MIGDEGIVAASADAEEGGAKDEVRSLPAASPAARAGTGAGEAKASASMLCKKNTSVLTSAGSST